MSDESFGFSPKSMVRLGDTTRVENSSDWNAADMDDAEASTYERALLSVVELLSESEFFLNQSTPALTNTVLRLFNSLERYSSAFKHAVCLRSGSVHVTGTCLVVSSAKKVASAIAIINICYRPR